ncbi:MAG TPA: type II toxin-antitoxin system VapC family toxin [Candidatus Desulfaltia sp.]|nr:type II toxin-antitoxin system VapC family toxin [Candidatus Desulfaltia sp.]
MYLLDTDVLSHVLKKRRSAELMARLEATPRAAQFTSAVNVAEITFGVLRQEGRKDLLRYYEDQVFHRLTILPFDRDSARIFGRIKADLERRGLPRFEPDLQIAAVAIANNLTMVSGNIRHFSGIPGLRVENWFACPRI